MAGEQLSASAPLVAAIQGYLEGARSLKLLSKKEVYTKCVDPYFLYSCLFKDVEDY